MKKAEPDMAKRIGSAILNVLSVMDEAKASHNDRLELLCYRSIDQLKRLQRELGQ